MTIVKSISVAAVPGSPATLASLASGREHNPFALLGPRPAGSGWIVRAYAPGAQAGWLCGADGAEEPMRALDTTGGFEWQGARRPAPGYRFRFAAAGRSWERRDAYAFPPQPSADDLFLFSAGRLIQGYRFFGAHPETIEGIAGVRFRVWAPDAERVSVVGDFNGWDGRLHPMANLGVSGAWELFVPDVGPGAVYKFEIRNRGSGAIQLKTDPYGMAGELRPGTAARVADGKAYAWGDAAWLEARAGWDWQHAPISIYEVHVGSWRRHPDGRFYSYRELADHLVPYVAALGYTHIEFMPLTEHPLDESWGYQTTGYFAPTARFDGSALYEHEDPRLGKHPDWGTHVFNYGRNEVRSFLLSSAHYWLAEFHFDGLRVDAVASMLYLDYSRKAGEWLPNRYGGRENLAAIDFLRELNVMVHADFPGALTIAEESTAWPMVSRPTYVGGLGFSIKWNMGWMNDTLAYLAQDPVYRRYHHDRLTFGQLYAYSENFLLPLSHDEVVHGKGSLPGKMPGDSWPLHGQRIRPAARMAKRRRTGLGVARRAGPCRHAAHGCRS